MNFFNEKCNLFIKTGVYAKYKYQCKERGRATNKFKNSRYKWIHHCGFLIFFSVLIYDNYKHTFVYSLLDLKLSMFNLGLLIWKIIPGWY